MRSLLFLLVVLSLLALATTSGSDTVYRWIDDGKVLCYTDDVKRVPVKYQDRAEAIELPALVDYERFTKAPSPFPSRLEDLRKKAEAR